VTTAGATRRLVLLRHAKSAWPDVPDHARPLARRGQRDAPVMGRWLHGAGYRPEQVLCSTARRARETWQLVQPALGTAPPAVFDSRIYQASAEELLDLIRHIPAAVGTLMIVGHDPGIPQLAVRLAEAGLPARTATGSRTGPPAMTSRMRVKFPTAAIAVLEYAGSWDRLGPGLTRLADFITPRELAAGLGFLAAVLPGRCRAAGPGAASAEGTGRGVPDPLGGDLAGVAWGRTVFVWTAERHLPAGWIRVGAACWPARRRQRCAGGVR
jgi:phosphohistidine phosphatase